MVGGLEAGKSVLNADFAEAVTEHHGLEAALKRARHLDAARDKRVVFAEVFAGLLKGRAGELLILGGARGLAGWADASGVILKRLKDVLEPVLVDDRAILVALLKRLPQEVSAKTAERLRDALGVVEHLVGWVGHRKSRDDHRKVAVACGAHQEPKVLFAVFEVRAIEPWTPSAAVKVKVFGHRGRQHLACAACGALDGDLGEVALPPLVEIKLRSPALFTRHVDEVDPGKVLQVPG